MNSERDATGWTRPKASLKKSNNSISDVFLVVVFALASFVFSYFVINFFSFKLLPVFLGAAVAVVFLVYFSFREMSFALILWLLSMPSAFKILGIVSMPGLPDLSIDRFIMIWIVMVFAIRIIVQGEKWKGPYWADAFLIGHALYILIQIKILHSAHFHFWVLCYLSPIFGFFYGKNTITKDSELRNILVFLLVLSGYFYLVSITQHYDIKQLVWPKSILNPDVGLFHHGRSRGPLLHPPLFGQILAMLLFVHFFFLMRIKNTLGLIALSFSMALFLMGFLFTYTRGPWVAAIAGMMVLAALSKEYRKIVLVLGVIVFLGGIVGLAQMLDSEFLQERLSNSGTIENRFGFLANAVRIFSEKPFFGVGFFKFQEVIKDYNQATYIPFYGLVKRGMAAHVPIHDIYIGRLSEEGLLGVFFQFAFYTVIFREFMRKWKRNVWTYWFDRNTMVLFAAIMVTYLVGGMVIDYRYFDLVNVLFYFLAGLIYGYDPGANIRESSSTSKPSQEPVVSSQ